MTFFSVLRSHFIKKAAKDIKPVPTDIWLEEQRNIAADWERRMIDAKEANTARELKEVISKKPISKKKPKAIKPTAKRKPKRRKAKVGKHGRK